MLILPVSGFGAADCTAAGYTAAQAAMNQVQVEIISGQRPASDRYTVNPIKDWLAACPKQTVALQAAQRAEAETGAWEDPTETITKAQPAPVGPSMSNKLLELGAKLNVVNSNRGAITNAQDAAASKVATAQAELDALAAQSADTAARLENAKSTNTIALLMGGVVVLGIGAYVLLK